MFVDSHCHLSDPELLPQIDRILADMSAADVDRALCICTSLEDFPNVHRLALAHANLWATVGVHPEDEGSSEASLDDLLERAALPRVVGIGETGLDYFRLEGRTLAQMQWQRDRFQVHIDAARQSGLPLIVHTRSAAQDTVAMLRDAVHASGSVRGVIHCFTESLEIARQVLDLGFYISFSGILTFKKSEDLRAIAKVLPHDRCLIETDSPYLAPVPFRGKINTPAYVPQVAQQLAGVWGVSVPSVGEQTARNFETLFAEVTA